MRQLHVFYHVLTAFFPDGMNDLQHIPENKYGPVLVTLNPPYEPKEGTVAGRWKYEHPVLDGEVSSFRLLSFATLLPSCLSLSFLPLLTIFS